jgi:hypothetical protein
VLVWGLGVAAAGSGALLVLFAVAQRFLGLQAVVDGSGEFPWVGALAVAAALPFVAFVLVMWSRVAFGSRTSHS